MLRLVTVTPADVDALFELVTMHEVPDQQELLAGMMQMHHHFAKTGDKDVMMVFTAPLYKQMLQIIEFPLMPADIAKHGMPEDRYLQIQGLMPSIRKNFTQPDLMDSKFLGVETKAPDKAYLN
jgi:hypothetical protein